MGSIQRVVEHRVLGPRAPLGYEKSSPESRELKKFTKNHFEAFWGLFCAIENFFKILDFRDFSGQNREFFKKLMNFQVQR